MAWDDKTQPNLLTQHESARNFAGSGLLYWVELVTDQHVKTQNLNGLVMGELVKYDNNMLTC